jgi:soluble lytic murein transglycosylase
LKIPLIPIFLAVSVMLHLGVRPADAAFYRFVDEHGVVHITNVPPTADYIWLMEESGEREGGTRYHTRSDYEELIFDKSVLFGVDPALVKAIVKVESDFDPDAVSPAGARGLMQLMPETARFLGVRDIDDPEDNVEGGVRYLSRLLDRFESRLPLVVAAYNAGETAVIKYGAVPPYSETREFVRRVLHYHKIYRGHM